MEARLTAWKAEAIQIQPVPTPLPVPANRQILVKAEWSGTNFTDLRAISGEDRGITAHYSVPCVPGVEIYGEVLAIGDGVTEFQVGDKIGAYTGGHSAQAWSQAAVIDCASATRIPVGVSTKQAAGLGMPAMTAVDAIDALELSAGSTVLVTGAGSSVGIAAVRILLSQGHELVTVSSDRHHEAMRSFGVKSVHTYAQLADQTITASLDGVLDTSGGTIWTQAQALVKPSGVAVSIKATPSYQTIVDWLPTGRPAPPAWWFLRPLLFFIGPSKKTKSGAPIKVLLAPTSGELLARALALATSGVLEAAPDLPVVPLEDLSATLVGLRDGKLRGRHLIHFP